MALCNLNNIKELKLVDINTIQTELLPIELASKLIGEISIGEISRRSSIEKCIL